MPNLAVACQRLPEPVRFLLCHATIGFGLSALFVGALLAAGPNGIGTLLLTAAGHWWPAALLWLFTGLTFGAVQIGVATMLMAAPASRPPRGSGAPVPAMAPLRVRR